MYGYLWDEAGSLTDTQHSRLMVRPWQPEWQVVLIHPYNAGDPADARSQGTGATLEVSAAPFLPGPGLLLLAPGQGRCDHGLC